MDHSLNEVSTENKAAINSLPETNKAPGQPLSSESNVLATGASLVQDFRPVKQICAHLNAFHAYVSDPTRAVETNHYCAHLNDGKRMKLKLAANVRQCLLYDSPEANARLIGIEYMITPNLFETLDSEEKKLWHSHVFEVKSGMLIMPAPRGIPQSIWEVAETKEMEKVIELYGKVYHLWQTDRGDKLPLGAPHLMTSYTSADQFDFERLVTERDERFRSEYTKKKALRKDIPEPNISEEADSVWKKKST